MLTGRTRNDIGVVDLVVVCVSSTDYLLTSLFVRLVSRLSKCECPSRDRKTPESLRTDQVETDGETRGRKTLTTQPRFVSGSHVYSDTGDTGGGHRGVEGPTSDTPFCLPEYYRLLSIGDVGSDLCTGRVSRRPDTVHSQPR